MCLRRTRYPSSLQVRMKHSVLVRAFTVGTHNAVMRRCRDTGLYVGYLRAIHGAHSQGETPEELIDNLKEVVDLLLDLEIPSSSLRISERPPLSRSQLDLLSRGHVRRSSGATRAREIRTTVEDGVSGSKSPAPIADFPFPNGVRRMPWP